MGSGRSAVNFGTAEDRRWSAYHDGGTKWNRAHSSMATDPALATPDELNAQLRDGAHEMMRDAVGQSVMRDRIPAGYLTPGKTLVQFWNLDFPIQGPDYSRAAVTALLTEMLSLRRLSPGAANALGLRIYTTLPAAYGRDGSVMAAMLLARCRQALAEPETWPSLLDDGELKDAYTAYKRNERGFEGVGVIFGMGMKRPELWRTGSTRTRTFPSGYVESHAALRSSEIRSYAAFRQDCGKSRYQAQDSTRAASLSGLVAHRFLPLTSLGLSAVERCRTGPRRKLTWPS